MAKVSKVIGTVAGIAAMAIPIVGPAVGMSLLAVSSATAIASAPSRNFIGGTRK